MSRAMAEQKVKGLRQQLAEALRELAAFPVMSASSTSVQALIDQWPSISEFAADLGVEYGTAKQMRRRSSISSTYWRRVVEAAARRELTGVTYEALASAHAPATAGAAA